MPPSQNSFQSGRDLLWKLAERWLPSVSLLHVLPPTHLQFQVVQEPQERRLTAIVQQIKTIKNERERANKQMKQAKSAVHKKQKAEEEQKRLVKVRAAKKRMFQLEHKERQRLQKRQRIK